MVKTQQEIQYTTSIHKELYPRWNWCGGYVIADVFDQGKKVVLTGYVKPSEEDAIILIETIEKCVNAKPEIFFRSIGTQTEILLSQQQITYQLHQQITNQLSLVLQSIYTKAEQDIQTTLKLPQYTVNTLIQYSQQGLFWIRDNSQQIIKGTIQVIEPLRQELIKYPNDWITRLNNDTIQKAIQAEKGFDLIQQKHPQKMQDELATFIIIESCKKSTLSRLIDSGIYKSVQSLSNLIESSELKDKLGLSQEVGNRGEKLRNFLNQPQTTDLMLTMIVQIACVYEKGNFSKPEKQGELVSILIISYLCSITVDADFEELRKNIIAHLKIEQILERMGISYDKKLVKNIQGGLDNMGKLNPFTSLLVSLGMNVSLFLLIGFIAQLVYKNYDNVVQILASNSLFNQIQEEASKSMKEMTGDTNIIEDVVCECYEIQKIELG